MFVDDGFVFVSEQKARLLYRNSAGPGDIVFTQRGTLGQIAIIPTESKFPRYVISQSQMRMTADTDRIEPRFLFHFFRSPRSLARISALALSTGVPHINLGILRKFTVEFPPVPEQRRIAAILDKADALRAKRRVAIAQLDTLTQAIFLDMFGDPAANSWEMTSVAGVAAGENAIRTGPFGSQLLHSEFTDAGIAVLGIDNAVQNRFEWAQRRFISEQKYRQLSRYRVNPGDVLITIMGTCGRCAIVPDDIGVAINTKHLCCITLDQRRCLPVFLQAYFLQHPIARSYLDRRAKGAVMDGLNMGIIKEMPIPSVPIDLQHMFGKRVLAIEAIKAAQLGSQGEFDALFASLQHRAFRGEL